MKTPLKTVLKSFLQRYEELESQKYNLEDKYELDFRALKQITEDLKKDTEFSCVFGFNEDNRPKNRYKDIVPYDFCRVILNETPDGEFSNYINASYIKGASGSFAYLAAQGPLPNTVDDFWQMIWHCDVQVIVMACNEQEGGKVKCEQYWAEADEIKQFGKLTVKLVSQTNICADFLIRTLLVQQDDEKREVWQFHYTTWPDHGVPDAVEPILHLVRLVRDCQASETAPILIHCSAGCGRTGTICAIDFVWTCLRTGKLCENFCLYDIIAEMRRQRIAMVQTKEQYMLVHKAVATMFQQQLNIINSHTYVNLDEEGDPIAWTSLNTDINSSESFKNLKIAKKRDSPSVPELVNGRDINEEIIDIERTKSFQSYNLNKFLNNEVENKIVLTNSTMLPDYKCHSQSIEALMKKNGSTDSIPFIDDDEDSKSEVQVRAKCGRAYLHLPSCDSISKIVNRFDPFADQLPCDLDQINPELDVLEGGEGSIMFHQSLHSNIDSSRSMSASIQFCSVSEKDDISIDSKFSSAMPASVDSARDSQDIECSSHRTCSVLLEDDKAKKSTLTKDSKSLVNRRPSVIKLKAFFERSNKSTKTDAKIPLFRHHSHPGYRSDSAPPELMSPERGRSNNKEWLIGLVTKKLRSSSVKSEHELRQENNTSAIRKLKQNLSNLSRTIQLSLQKSNNVQNKYSAVWHDVPALSTADKESNVDSTKMEENQMGRSMWYDKDTNQNVMELKNPQRKYKPAETIENINQKFVVNVLSSGHSPIIVGKHPNTKPLSPKLKNRTDFEILRSKPFLGFINPTNKPNDKDTSTLWFEKILVKDDQHENTVFNESKNTAHNNEDSATKSKMSNSIFYIDAGDQKVPPHLPLKRKNSEDLRNIANSKDSMSPKLPIKSSNFFSSTSSNEKATLQNTEITNVKIEIADDTNKSEIAVPEACEIPPALPRKHVIGKNFNIAKFIDPQLKKDELTTPSINKVVPTAKLSPKAAKRKNSVDILKLEMVQTDFSNDLYMNVNPITKKNIIQIENTLRNHPRGAIIDLTSRQSYSMEEELALALKKLPEPLKDNLTQNWKAKGYEVIWPEPIDKEKRVEDDIKLRFLAESLKSSASQKTTISGPCYSPPLRRSGLSSFPVMKSQSCASFEWLQNDDNDLKFENMKEQVNNDKSDAAVNVAVVQLSSLLDALTTKTLSEDLDLKKNESSFQDSADSSGIISHDKIETQHIYENVNCDIGIEHSSDDAHHYETVHFPIKKVIEDEIVFHFPPPPPNPPSPVLLSPTESFDIVCKDGVLNVSKAQCDSSSTNTFEQDYKSDFDMSTPKTAQVDAPVPSPRRSKQAVSNAHRNLKKSSSLSTLASITAPPRYENVIIDSNKVVQVDATLLEDSETVSTPKSNVVPQYEYIFPKADKTSSDFKSAEKLRSQILLNELADIDLRKHFKLEQEKDSVAVQSEQDDLNLAEIEIKQGSSGINLEKCSCTDSSDSKYVSDKDEAVYGKINKASSVPVAVQQGKVDPNSKQNGQKDSIGSRKSYRAPQLSEVINNKQNELSTQTDAKLGDVKRPQKTPSRKNERAPDPPPVKGNAAYKVLPNLEPKEPIYSIVHKPKLQAVIENISDLPSAVEKCKTLGNQIQRTYVRGDKMPKSFTRGLQHSHSDASLYLAIQSKFQRKSNVFDQRTPLVQLNSSRRSTSSESSSDSECSFQTSNLSSIQNLKNEPEIVPVAPPRSKRRSTADMPFISYQDDAKGPVHSDVPNAQIDDLAMNEQAPNVPLKSKNAFELPGTFSFKGK